MGGAGGVCAVFFYFNLILIDFFFSPQTTLNAEVNGVVSSHQAHPGLVVLVAVLDALSSASAGCIVPVTVAFYVAVAVSAAVTVAADDVFSAGPFS